MTARSAFGICNRFALAHSLPHLLRSSLYGYRQLQQRHRATRGAGRCKL